VSLRVTLTGKAVAKSGIQPASAVFLLSYLSQNAEELVELDRACSESELDDCDDIAFVLVAAIYGCPEYSSSDLQRRYLPYQLLADPLTGPQGRLRSLLVRSSVDAVNAAVLAWRWIRGSDMKHLEAVLDIRSGVLTAMFSDAAGILRGTADILYAATSARSEGELPTGVEPNKIPLLRNLVAAIRQVATRLEVGLPDDVVWMRTLSSEGTNFPAQRNRSALLTRRQIIELRGRGFTSPTDLLDPGRFPELLDAIGPRSEQNRALAQAVQQATRTWRQAERLRLVESQRKRLPADCRDILLKFYRAREVEFERVLEDVFSCLSINIAAKDDGTVPSFPDFILDSIPLQTLAVECKSKTAGDSVNFNDATDVLRKAGVNGYRDAFKVTVCQPYVSPDVPRRLTNCDDLSIVNAEDLAEAFVRLKNGQLDLPGFADWISRPGQAMREHLATASVTIGG